MAPGWREGAGSGLLLVLQMGKESSACTRYWSCLCAPRCVGGNGPSPLPGEVGGWQHGPWLAESLCDIVAQAGGLTGAALGPLLIAPLLLPSPPSAKEAPPSGGRNAGRRLASLRSRGPRGRGRAAGHM